MLPSREVIQILTHATVFVCPSVYEPMGIVNLEAMACETAVVATATGGIPEVVADGETGLLVPIDQVATDGTPRRPGRFAADLAERVNGCWPTRPRGRGWAGPGGAARVEHFSWRRIAERTMDLYRRCRSPRTSTGRCRSPHSAAGPPRRGGPASCRGRGPRGWTSRRSWWPDF